MLQSHFVLFNVCKRDVWSGTQVSLSWPFCIQIYNYHIVLDMSSCTLRWLLYYDRGQSTSGPRANAAVTLLGNNVAWHGEKGHGSLAALQIPSEIRACHSLSLTLYLLASHGTFRASPEPPSVMWYVCSISTHLVSEAERGFFKPMVRIN